MRTPSQRQSLLALESLLNEAAASAGIDAIQFRLNHTSDRRLIELIERTAEAGGWQSRPSPDPGARRIGDVPVRGRGMAVVYRSGTYWVGIAEVAVTPSTGVVQVRGFTLGIDLGYIALGFSWTLDCEKVLAGGVSR